LRRIFTILLLPLLGTFLWASPPETVPGQSGVFTLHEYMAELDRLDSSVLALDKNDPSIAELLQQVPTVWRVKTDQQTFEISFQWLLSSLIDWQKKSDKTAQNLISKRLEHMHSEAASFESLPPDASEKRTRLNSILGAEEFHNVHGPTWFDRLKERMIRFLLGLLGRTLGSSVIPVIGNILIYGLIAVAVLLLAYWMYRSIRTSGELETIMPHPLPVSSKEWTLWMAEARAAAERGNWRDAIHLGYWCGVSFLEAQGLWRPDYARTPREYLRLLPTASEHHPTLVALTRNFEIVWYGKQEADATAFSQTLAQLEKLGCR
jgi:hypothetical protein